MSVTSSELNYLIWRYLQETGNELTAYALQKETQIHTLDSTYENKIPIGCLVDLVQKGIFYCEVDHLVDEKGKLRSKDDIKSRFCLFQALKDSQTEKIEATGDFASRDDEADASNDKQEDIDILETKDEEFKKESSQANLTEESKMDMNNKEDEDFIKLLTPIKTFAPSISSSWNPKAVSILSLGEHKSSAIITTLSDVQDGKCQSTDISLPHPLGISVTLSTQDSKFSEDITCVSWSNKGNFLLTGSFNGELRLWTIDGKLRNVLTLHHSPIIAIKWNFDNTYVLSHDQANNTIIWSVSTGTAVQHIHHDILKAILPIGTGSQIASSTTVSTNTNEIYGTDPIWLQNAVYAVPGIAGGIFLFNVTSRQPVPIGKLLGHTAAIGCMSYNEDLKLLATGSDDTTVRIWKGKSQSSSQILMGHDQAIISVDWLNSIKEEGTETQKESIKGKEACQYVLSSSLDGSVRIWNAYSGKIVAISFLDGVPIFEAKLSPNKDLFAVSTEDGTVSIFDVSLTSLEKIIKLEKEVGSSLIVGDVAKLKVQAQYLLSGPEDSENYVTSVTWNSDSTKLCVSYNASETVIFEI